MIGAVCFLPLMLDLSHFQFAIQTVFGGNIASILTFLKNFIAAIQCLKRKRLYEQQIEQLGNFQLRIHDQVIFLCYIVTVSSQLAGEGNETCLLRGRSKGKSQRG